ncbi:hypothetical protein [uncultured Streptococcus sp.]|uniref:hypothetical protein n=1 Tax=uncultured Streptococcus sp. TaxID=83427 RepID=UPI0025E0D421|nr:hypothetical protein [uncultured Streptococcus sp.]
MTAELLLSFVCFRKRCVFRRDDTTSYIEVYEYEKVIFTQDENIENTEPKKERKKKRNFDELSTEEQNERLERISKTRKNSRWEVMRLVDINFDKRTSFLTLTVRETENIIKHNEVLYETEYSGKIFKNGELLENRIEYKKIKID